ncbi:MAG: hypothetical protein HYT06_00800, partial [Candidatus Levybacteria bacterium]|nr:hypothetical protein [Candidatus Levybacteria bacterium]
MKRLKDWFDDQDKFIKATIVIAILLIISTPIIVTTYFSIFQKATRQPLSMGISMYQGSEEMTDSNINEVFADVEQYKNEWTGRYPGTYSIWNDFVHLGGPANPSSAFPPQT